MAALVEFHVLPAGFHILEVFHLVRAGLHQKPFIDPDRHIVGRRNRHVEAMATSAHFFQCRVVGVIVGDGDFDVVFFFELLDDFGARVIAPVIDVQHAIGMGGAGESEQGGACQHGFQGLFHGCFLHLGFSFSSGLSERIL